MKYLEINESIVRDTLKRLGILITSESGSNLIFKCINPHHEDNTPSCSIHKDKGIWRCWSCDLKGNVFQLVVYLRGCNHQDAIKFIHKDEIISDDRLQRIKRRLQEIPQINLDRYSSPRKFSLPYKFVNLNQENKYTDYLLKRRIDLKIAKRMKLGFVRELGNVSEKGLKDRIGYRRARRYFRYENRIIIPIFYKEICRGVIGRKMGENSYLPEKKYLYDYGMELRKLLYNIDNVKGRSCILVEGTFDALRGESFGLRENFVAILGSNISNYQIKLLIEKKIKRIYLAFDNDRAGRKIVDKFSGGLKEGFDVYRIMLPRGMDVADCNKRIFIECMKKAKKIIKRPFLKKIGRIRKKYYRF